MKEKLEAAVTGSTAGGATGSRRDSVRSQNEEPVVGKLDESRRMALEQKLGRGMYYNHHITRVNDGPLFLPAIPPPRTRKILFARNARSPFQAQSQAAS